jgi:glucose uptake protein
MYQPEAYTTALVLMLGTMVCWGSWANTMKLTPGWPFQLYYWDYVIGMLLATLVWGFSLGSNGTEGLSFLADLRHADLVHFGFAIAGGAIFNIANLLLVAVIEIAGLAVAFPIAIGLALVVGVILNFLVGQRGNPWLLFTGVLLVVIAIVVDAQAYRQREGERASTTRRNISLCIICGLLMGIFYPLVARAMKGPQSLGPYGVAFAFALGVAASSLVVNPFLMRRPLTGVGKISMHSYFAAKPIWHCWGAVGGAIWGTGAVWNFVASHSAIVGPAVSYAIGQGATMVSAVWGVVVWREFASAPASSRRLIPWMFLFFLAGLSAVALAPVVSFR